MRKLLVSDYDQTFYLNDEDIEVNKAKVHEFREAGNIFIIATGRSFADFKKKWNQYKFEYDYVILNHGATILDNKDNIIFNVSIDNDVVKNIKEDVHLEKSISHFCCSLFESRVDFDHKNLTKIETKYSNRGAAWEANENINKKYSKYVNSYFLTSNAIEIISNKTSKCHAIRILAKDLDIDEKDIYTVGDGYSDIEMIKEFNGYSMKDSVPELSSVAKHSISSVSEIIEMILKEQ